jgi:hypothetical protein
MTRRDSIVAWVGMVAVVVGIVTFANLPPRVHGQSAMTGLPAQIPAGSGAPTSTCDATVVSQTTALLYDNTQLTSGNSIYKCAWDPTSSTYHWFAPFSTPILGTTASIGGALLALNGTVSGTGSVPGAAVGSNCIATPSDGSLVSGVNIYCNVATAGVATVTLQATVLGTPPAKTWTVRVIP